MNVLGTILIFILILVVVKLVSFWIKVKKAGGLTAYIDKKNKELDKREQDLEQDSMDDFIDSKSFNFIVVGAVATLLFLVTGILTGNALYLTLMLFIITALIFLFFSPPHNKF